MDHDINYTPFLQNRVQSQWTFSYRCVPRTYEHYRTLSNVTTGLSNQQVASYHAPVKVNIISTVFLIANISINQRYMRLMPRKRTRTVYLCYVFLVSSQFSYRYLLVMLNFSVEVINFQRGFTMEKPRLRVKSNISGREPYFHIYQFRPISEGEDCVDGGVRFRYISSNDVLVYYRN